MVPIADCMEPDFPRSRENATPVTDPPGPVSPELAMVDPALRRVLLEASPASQSAYAAAGVADEAATVSAGGLGLGRRVRWPRREGAAVVGGLTLALLAGYGIGSGSPFTNNPDLHSAAKVPTASRQPRPVRTSRAAEVSAASVPKRSSTRSGKPHVRRFVWAPVDGADSYEVAFYAAGARVLDTRTRATSIKISIGTHGARAVPQGTYEWYVWAWRGNTRDRVAIAASRLVLR